MVYERSFEIEKRLQMILRLIQTGKYSTPALAEALGVSIPTVSRAVTALRQRGMNIHAKKNASGWRYVIATIPNPNSNHSKAQIPSKTDFQKRSKRHLHSAIK
jgi:biotin operon repressor